MGVLLPNLVATEECGIITARGTFSGRHFPREAIP